MWRSSTPKTSRCRTNCTHIAHEKGPVHSLHWEALSGQALPFQARKVSDDLEKSLLSGFERLVDGTFLTVSQVNLIKAAVGHGVEVKGALA